MNKIIDECISRTEVLADIRDVRIEKTVKNDFSLDCDFRWICEAVSNIVKTVLSIPTAVMSKFQPKRTVCIRKSP